MVANLNVWLGKKNKVEVAIAEDLYLTVPKRKKKTIKAVMEYNGPILLHSLKESEIKVVISFLDQEIG